MDDQVDKKIDKEMASLLDSLTNMSAGSEEYQSVLNSVVKLGNLRIDNFKARSEDLDMYLRREVEKYKVEEEIEIARNNVEDDRKFKIIDFAIKGGNIIVPAGLFFYWIIMGYRFEETGSFTSKTFQTVMSKFKLGW